MELLPSELENEVMKIASLSKARDKSVLFHKVFTSLVDVVDKRNQIRLNNPGYRKMGLVRWITQCHPVMRKLDLSYSTEL